MDMNVDLKGEYYNMSIVILAEKPSQGMAYADAFQNTLKKDGYIKINDSRFLMKKYLSLGDSAI